MKVVICSVFSRGVRSPSVGVVNGRGGGGGGSVGGGEVGVGVGVGPITAPGCVQYTPGHVVYGEDGVCLCRCRPIPPPDH